MEHLHHFKLAEDPFRNDHSEKFAVETRSQSDALARLDRAVRQGRGLIAMIGAVGSGKTIVARRLYEELEEEVFEASMMVVLRPSADSDWLLGRFARELGVEAPASEREAVIGQIYERLAIIREDGRHAVLIVDDAHGLAARETLLEVCGLVKLEYEDRRLLSVVLVGAEPLARVLASDPLLAHHVDVRVSLQPMDREDAAVYLGQRLERAGGDPSLILPGAVAGLHELADGSPGRMNTLADNAFFEAYLAGRTELTRSDVERAHSDLGWGACAAVAPLQAATAAGAGNPDASFSASAAARPAPTPGRPVATDAMAERTIIGGAPLAEITSPEAGAPVADLDSELEAVFEAEGADPQSTMLMDFDQGPPAASPVPAGRAMAAPTEIQLEPDDALDGPPKRGDEVDDLFMELLDD